MQNLLKMKNIDQKIKSLLGAKIEGIEKDIISNGYKWDYEIDNYVVYSNHNYKILYDITNKCIVGYSKKNE